MNKVKKETEIKSGNVIKRLPIKYSICIDWQRPENTNKIPHTLPT